MLLMLVGLCSCVNRGPVATTETGIPMRVTEFTYKGHSYIWFSKSSGQSGTENPDSYWYGKTELVQGRLEEAKQRLERTSNMAYFEVGYGQLFPMVKRYDYEKALRIYEQEQKEADLERQE